VGNVRNRICRRHPEPHEVTDERQGEDWVEHGLVFPSNRGTPMEPRNLVCHFKAALKRAGLLETTRFHDQRHSCAALLIAQDVHPRVVMEILRHANIGVTMNTYAHVIPEQQRDATAKLAELFAELPPVQQEEVVR
jgi:integrase